MWDTVKEEEMLEKPKTSCRDRTDITNQKSVGLEAVLIV